MNDQNIKKLTDLIEKFRKNESEYCSGKSTYNETETRVDFVNSFFEILGWDVSNEQGLPKPFREVILEANVDVGDKNKKPDYEIRFNGQRKYYIEAKKPLVNIFESKDACFQTKRYGWSAKLPVSILTNFKQLVIFDCTNIPQDDDLPNKSVIKSYQYTEYLEKFEEIYGLLSRESVVSGKFDNQFKLPSSEIAQKKLFDSFFLNQIEKWRLLLAKDIYKNNKFDLNTINYLVQMFINRIVFLRICEDRNLETYGSLQQLNPNDAVKQLLQKFEIADKKYNSGLFSFIKDKLTPSTVISNETLLAVANDLYYPNSPYTFSVVSSKILGQVYDLFISRGIALNDNGEIVLEEKPQVKISGGVFTTPEYIVKEIVEDTLGKRLLEVSVDEIKKIKVADISCGSGIFLIESFELIQKILLKKSIESNLLDNLQEDGFGDFDLKLSEKHRILKEQIFGVDIDEQAVEVAKFSLLVKVFEDVALSELGSYVEKNQKILPDIDLNIRCGNSLIDSRIIANTIRGNVDKIDKLHIRPVNWLEMFPSVFNNKNPGFDVIVGNPPYVKIQHLAEFFPQEFEIYKNKDSGYKSSLGSSFDLYQLFFEKSLELLNKTGLLGYIIPNKFLVNIAGGVLRGVISDGKLLDKLIHFGSLQVFEGQATTYTCLIILSKTETSQFIFNRVVDLDNWKIKVEDNSIVTNSELLNDKPWIFPSEHEKEIFKNIEDKFDKKLEDYAEIFVGLQTSADNIFIIEPTKVNDNCIEFIDCLGKSWRVEGGLFNDAILDYRVDYFKETKPNKKIFFPYLVENEKATIIDEGTFKRDYPLTYKYLSSFRNTLEKRSMGKGNSKWYQYGRSQSLTKLDGRKMIVKNPSLFACVTEDSNNIKFTGGGNGPYYGIKTKEDTDACFYLVLAILNSPLFDRWVKIRSSVFRGGYYSFGKQYIEKFPVFDFKQSAISSKVEELVIIWKKIIELNKVEETAPSKIQEIYDKKYILKTEADKIVFSLYGEKYEDLVQ